MAALLLCAALFACGPAEESKPKADTAVADTAADAVADTAADAEPDSTIDAAVDATDEDVGPPAPCHDNSGAPLPDGTPCDDGLPCRPDDACRGGACKATSMLNCGSQYDVDCKDDGDLCNGLPYCDKSGTDGDGKPVWKCAVNPATVVSCDQSSDGICEQSLCEASSGACKKEPKPEFTACDDGVACSVGDFCDGKGSCTPGTWTCCTGRFHGVRLSYGTADDRKKVEEPALVRCVRDLP